MDRKLRITGWMGLGGLLLAAWVIISGCQGILHTYIGAKARSDSLVALADGTRGSGLYRTEDVIIDYQWARKGNELQLSGSIKFTPRLQRNFTMIPVFDLSLFFTDAEGVILQQRYLSFASNGDPAIPLRVSEKITLPPETAMMAFTYSGAGRDSGSDGDRGGGDMPFWQVPIVR